MMNFRGGKNGRVAITLHERKDGNITMKARVLGTSELPLGRTEPGGDLRINSVKHLLRVFPDSLRRTEEIQKQILRRQTPPNDVRVKRSSVG